MAVFRILSLDGGGVRGIFSMVLLDRLCREAPGLLDGVDLYAGTSTGGIIALGLADGFTPAEGIALYRRFAAEVFKDSLLDNIRDLGRLIGADYSTRPLKKIMQETYRSETLADLRQKGNLVLIPTFDLDAVKNGVRAWKPKFFHNFPGPDSDDAELVVDVALRTSAAPSYFPVYQGYVDGGVAANNPCMAALAQALNAGYRLDEIRLLSLSAGFDPQYIAGERLDWGYVQWIRPLISLMLEGSMDVAAYQCKAILGEPAFHRLNPALPEPIPWDAAERMDDLAAYANDADISEAVTWVKTHFLA